MLLPKDIRAHLAYIFDIPVSAATEIRDQELITDGRTIADLEALSKERMCEYIGSEESFDRAFELTVAKARAELNPPVGTIAAKEQAEVPVAPASTPEPVVAPEPVPEATAPVIEPTPEEVVHGMDDSSVPSGQISTV